MLYSLLSQQEFAGLAMNTALKTELQKEKYQALSDEECLINLPIEEQVLGRLQGSNKLDLVTMVLADDLQDNIQEKIDLELTKETPSEPYIKLAKAVKKALDPILLMSEQYWINLGHDDVIVMINNAELYGILTPTQVATMKTLATYTINSEFKSVTLQDVIDARYEPVTIEANNYQDVSYLITTGNQGIDIEISSDVDCSVKVELYVCVDNGNQSSLSDYVNLGTVGNVKIVNGRGILALSSRKVRMYNKIFVTADKNAVLDVVVKKNRG